MTSSQATDSLAPVSLRANMTDLFSMSFGPSSSLMGTPCTPPLLACQHTHMHADTNTTQLHYVLGLVTGHMCTTRYCILTAQSSCHGRGPKCSSWLVNAAGEQHSWLKPVIFFFFFNALLTTGGVPNRFHKSWKKAIGFQRGQTCTEGTNSRGLQVDT